MERIYLDYAATTPVREEVLSAMLPYLRDNCGNPGSQHYAGRQAKAAIENARQSVAEAIGALPQEIYFTAGGTESNNWVLQSIAGLSRKKRIAISAIEHHAVLNPCERLKSEGFDIKELQPDGFGVISPDAIPKDLFESTLLVSVMTANNEIGTLQPIPELTAEAKAQGSFFHTDAVQAVGHIPIHVHEWNVDFLSLSGHKFGAPKGIGALYIRKGIPLEGFLLGGSQENGRRAGTENVPGIVGLGCAITLAVRDMEEEGERLIRYRNRLIEGILSDIPNARLNGHPTQRLPGNVHFSFEGIRSDALLARLDMAGIEASAGAACTAGTLTPSHVLKALYPDDQAQQAHLRLTMGRKTTEAHIEKVLEILPGLVADLRKRRDWNE